MVPYKDICLAPEMGEYQCIKYREHAFVHERGRLIDLNALVPSTLGWELTWAFDINNYGAIVGQGFLNGKVRAFLLTPAESRDQCKDTRWKKFGFKNQGQCIQFLNNGK